MRETQEARKLDPTLVFSMLRTGQPSGLLEWRKALGGSVAAPGRQPKQPEQSMCVPVTQGFKAPSNATAPENSGAWLWGLGWGTCPNKLTRLTKHFLKKEIMNLQGRQEIPDFKIQRLLSLVLGEPHPGTGSLYLPRSICTQKIADSDHLGGSVG